jgi:T-complex protein 1 subunit alpha
MEGEETFEASLLGQAEDAMQELICDDELVILSTNNFNSISTTIQM